MILVCNSDDTIDTPFSNQLDSHSKEIAFTVASFPGVVAHTFANATPRLLSSYTIIQCHNPHPLMQHTGPTILL